MRSTWAFRGGAAALVLTTVALLVATGSFIAAIAPLLAIVVVWGALRAPMSAVMSAALFVLLACDNVKENPAMGLYKSFLWAPGKVLYSALDDGLGLPGVKLFGIEACLLALWALVLVRWLVRPPILAEERVAPPAPLVRALAIATAAIVVVEVWGILRGGAVRFSMLQFRPMLATPLFAWLCATSIGTRRDLQWALGAIVVAGFVRALVGIHAWSTILRVHIFGGDGDGDGSYVMTHSDSTLLSFIVVLALCAVWFAPRLRTFLWVVPALPVVGFAIHINNRRIALVQIALSLVVVYALDARLRRFLHRAALVAAPVALLYVAAAWRASGAWAQPVQTLRSVVQSSDNSAQTRDIENYNLVSTIKDHMLLGSGFGHEYQERVVAYDISHAFEAYRYVPHNSLLGLFLAGGVLGFAAFWSFTVVGVFLAARGLRRARDDVERIACAAAIAVVVQYGVLAWGDMGLQSWMSGLVLAAALGCVAHVASRTRALDAEPVRA